MEIKGRFVSMYESNGETTIVLKAFSPAHEIEDEFLELLELPVLNISIDKQKKKRSLNANAYMWVLVDKIANHKDIRSSKEEIYEKYIQEYAPFRIMDNGRPFEIELREDIDIRNLAGHWKPMNISIPMEGYKAYVNLLGSHEFNSIQMSHFIGYIVEDAKYLGIETLTPRELAQMCAAWKPK